MIVSVSPNPALDRVHVTRGFQPGRQSRAISAFLQPGGSGAHASAVAQAFGAPALSLGLLGGQTGALWKQEATRRGLIFDMTPVEGETRVSFCLVDLELGSQVEAVEAGPQVDASSLERLLERLELALPQASLVVLSGSLPAGLPLDSYALMTQMANNTGVPVLLDAHSEPLKLALSQRPWMIKPNLAEFHALLGRETSGMVERTASCLELSRQRNLVIALSMAEEGLLLTTPDAQWHLYPPLDAVHLPGGTGQNVIGCGDALVGALAAEYISTGDLLSAARLGLAAAHQNLGTLGVPDVDAGEARRLAAGVRVEQLWPESLSSLRIP